MARQKSRRCERTLGGLLQEERQKAGDLVRRSPRRSLMLRLDRRRALQSGQAELQNPFLSAPAGQHLESRQRSPRTAPEKARQNGGAGVAGFRCPRTAPHGHLFLEAETPRARREAQKNISRQCARVEVLFGAGSLVSACRGTLGEQRQAGRNATAAASSAYGRFGGRSAYRSAQSKSKVRAGTSTRRPGMLRALQLPTHLQPKHGNLT